MTRIQKERVKAEHEAILDCYPWNLHRRLSPVFAGVQIALAIAIIVRPGPVAESPALTGALIATLLLHYGFYAIMWGFRRLMLALMMESYQTGYEQGLELAAAGNRKRRNWLRRRAEALAHGDRFNEPPPQDRD